MPAERGDDRGLGARTGMADRLQQYAASTSLGNDMKSKLGVVVCIVALVCGCSVWNPMGARSQSVEAEDPIEQKVRLVGDLAIAVGTHPVVIESVGLVVDLPGTGSDPQPSPQRAALLSEMQGRKVKDPNTVLASSSTAMVVVRAVLRPGIQQGDTFDVQVRVPSGSEATSLRGGHLLETRLRPLAVLDHRIHSGRTLGIAKGPIMVDPSPGKGERSKVLQTRGTILGGGRALISRPLLLVLKPEHQSVRNSARIQEVVNKRFHTFDKGTKVGVATAQTDERIVLRVHPRYKDNIARYIQVVRSIALRESETDRLARMELLEKQLLDPITSSRAAVRLEAIGRQSAKVLKRGTAAEDAEVRFYAAEALAYLDEAGAAEVLAQTARDEPAFRVFALAALSAMEDVESREALRQLLQVASAETRYGAFRALTERRLADPMVEGEMLGGEIHYHVLDTGGPPMIHVTRSRRPEIVLFGRDQRLIPPLAIEAGNQIMLTGLPSGEIAVARFALGEPDQRRTVSTRVDEVIRAIVELGGTYPDVVQALQEAKAAGALSGRFEVDALPVAGRTYDRVVSGAGSEADRPRLHPNSPMPNLFSHAAGKSAESAAAESSSPQGTTPEGEAKKKQQPKRSFLARIMGRDSS